MSVHGDMKMSCLLLERDYCAIMLDACGCTRKSEEEEELNKSIDSGAEETSP